MKKSRIFKWVTCLSLALVLLVSPIIAQKIDNDNNVTLRTTTVEATKSQVDYESILNSFEDATMTKEESVTTFVGYHTYDVNELLTEIDLVSETSVDTEAEARVKYTYTYDEETSLVTLTAQMDNNGEVLIDEVVGVAFLNEKGEIDAIFDIDGEEVLLSELQDGGVVQNCGWFKNLFKSVAAKVVAAVVVVVAVAAVAAVIAVSAGAALGGVVAAGAIAGGVAGGVCGAGISYEETGEISGWAVVGGIAGGIAIGALTGFIVASIAGVGSCGFAKGSFSTVDDCVNYHFRKHGAEVGARTAKEYAKMAAETAKQVVKNNIPAARAVSGATPNVFRYVVGNKYIHMAIEKTKIIIVSFGLI